MREFCFKGRQGIAPLLGKLAEGKIATGLLDGSASKDGDGVKRTCAVFGIKHTYNAIYKFLKEGEVK